MESVDRDLFRAPPPERLRDLQRGQDDQRRAPDRAEVGQRLDDRRAATPPAGPEGRAQRRPRQPPAAAVGKVNDVGEALLALLIPGPHAQHLAGGIRGRRARRPFAQLHLDRAGDGQRHRPHEPGHQPLADLVRDPAQQLHSPTPPT